MPHSIYALIDPRTEDVRYVGVSVDVARRLRRHRMNTTSMDHKSCWIRSLKSEGLSFGVWILEVVPDGGAWQDAERRWIALFRQLFDLTNATDGGDGMVGYVCSEATRAKLSLAGKGKPMPEGFGDRVRAGWARYLEEHPEIRVERSRHATEWQTGRKLSESHKKAVGRSSAAAYAAGKGLAALTEEQIKDRAIKSGLARRGKPKSPEHVAKVVASIRRTKQLKREAALAAGGTA